MRKPTLSKVECTYTGGNIYVCTAKFGDVYLVTDFEMFGSYDIPYDEINEDIDFDYDSHWKDSAYPLPTWRELLNAIMKSYYNGRSKNMDPSEVEHQIKFLHPNLSTRLNED